MAWTQKAHAWSKNRETDRGGKRGREGGREREREREEGGEKRKFLVGKPDADITNLWIRAILRAADHARKRAMSLLKAIGRSNFECTSSNAAANKLLLREIGFSSSFVTCSVPRSSNSRACGIYSSGCFCEDERGTTQLAWKIREYLTGKRERERERFIVFEEW